MVVLCVEIYPYMVIPLLQISDEVGAGNVAEVRVTGRSNQQNPVFDANGDQVDGIDFSVSFREEEDTQVSIVSARAFITDEDIDAQIENVTVTLTNPELSSSQEFLSLIQAPPATLQVSNTGTVVVVTAPDPASASETDFITVLLSIRYNNIADEPVGVTRVIEFTVFDGGRENSPRARTNITIQTTNDIPVIDLNGPSQSGLNGSLQYREATPPELIAPDLVILDPDSITLTMASVRLDQVFDTNNESLSLDTSLLPNGVTCSPSSCNSTSLTLTGTADKSLYQTLLRSLRYVNLRQPQDLPNLRDRVIFVQVNDGTAASDPTSNILIDFLPINPRVIIELDVPNQNYFTTFMEGQQNRIPAVGVVRVVDTSLTTLQSVVVTIRDNLPNGVREEREEITLSTIGGLPVAVEINTVLKRITFSQEAPVSVYLEAINRVLYFNGEDEPYPINRFVDFLVVPGGGAPNDEAYNNITIININDHAPICSPAIETVFVREDTASGTPIHQFEATDADIGRDGDIFYTLVGGNSSLFSVSRAGEVQLRGELDFEGIPSYSIIVQVCDFGLPQMCCNFTLVINVTDFNDNPPIFERNFYNFSVTENNVTRLATFLTSDRDSGVNAQVADLQIVSHSPQGGCLGLFATGVLPPPFLSTISPGLNYEVADTCTLVLVATDGGSPALSGNTTVRINVINEDDFPPEFSMPGFIFQVVEENPFPLSVGRVNASDRDSPFFSFSLMGTAMFSINNETGEIFIRFSSNFTVATSHMFQAVATDPSGNAASASVTVQVIPINNEAPRLDLNVSDPTTSNARTPVTFVEESTTPTLLLESDPLVTDPDAPAISLAVTMIRVRIANSGDTSVEQLSVNTGMSTPSFTPLSSSPGELLVEPLNPTTLSEVYALLRSIQYLNTEDELSACRSDLYPCAAGNASRTILFSVFDGVFYSNEAETYVTFEAVNDPPVIDLDTTASGQGYTTLFQETAGAVNIANTGLLSITDDDDTDAVELDCTLTNPQDGNEEFLQLVGSIPSGLNITNTSHMISIVGEAPLTTYEAVLSLIQYDSVTPDPTENPARLVQCTVSDGDLVSNVAVATVTFRAVNQAPNLDLDIFSPGVNFTTTFREEGGAVSLTGTVNLFDADDANMLSLTVTLLGGAGSQEILAVDSTQVPSPLTSSYTYPTLRVNGQGNILVYRAIIESVTYNNLDSEIADASDRVVEFVVTDENGEGSQAVFAIVQIQPVDDNIPVFVPDNTYNFTVSENSAVNTLVGTVEVRDFDLPPGQDIPTFTILSSNPTFGTSDFVILNNPSNPLQGQVRVLGDIDYDNRAMIYHLEVLAQSGPFNATATVWISVNNLPDLPPIFTVSPPEFYVFENEVPTRPLMPSGVVAVDQDGLDPILYSISGNVILGIELIDINPSTGELTVVNNINREDPFVGTEFSVTITATDSVLSISRDFRIVVLGVNEFPPVFSQSAYVAEVEENAPPSGIVATVSATDPDEVPDILSSGFMTNISFSIRPGPGSDAFSIGAESGEIIQLSPIDFEEYSTITLRVVASDNDFTPAPLTTEVNVFITVRNLNDEPPHFVNLTDFIVVSELSALGTVFYTIELADPDPNANLQVRFAGTDPPMFTLNSANGEVSVEATLDADSIPNQFNFVIILSDLSTHVNYTASRTVSANITIAIMDENDQVPTFALTLFQGSVVENEPPGSSVLRVTATDRDYGLDPYGIPNGNNELRYFLVDAPAGVFAINETTGVITKLVIFDREVRSEYIFRVGVRDVPLSGSSNMEIVEVRVEVLDVNEHAPQADPSRYTISVSEATSVLTRLQTYVGVRWNITSE